MRDVSDRPVNFNYDYRIRCSRCPALTTLTSQTYDVEPDRAHVACQGCGSDIHFGPAVLGLRDADDPALCDQRVADLAWYHTSTDPAWPRPEPPAVPDRTRDLLRRAIPPDEAARVHRHLTTQALHVGTYEAAVESMLRRMRDQGDADTPFYLYRVMLRGGLTVEPGWRDENEAEAAQITQTDLGDLDVDGIRYLNVHESPGSISLALQRRAVDAVQVTGLPPDTFRVEAPAGLVSLVQNTRARIRELGAHQSLELNPLDAIRKRFAESRGEPFVRGLTAEQCELEQHVGQALVDEFLAGVSLPVRSRFTAALPSWSAAQSPDTDAAVLGRFATMATVLTRPEQVLCLLSTQPWRQIS